MRTFSKRTMIVAAASAAALTAGGIAYAYYNASVSGSGSGSATAANSTILDVVPSTTAGPTSITGLVPGGSSKTSTVTLKNSNAFSVHVPAGSVTVSGMTAGPTDCDTLTLSGISGSGSYIEQTIAAGGTVPVTVTVSMADLATNQTPCNGGSFTLTYTAS
jgi:hypothetical protein